MQHCRTTGGGNSMSISSQLWLATTIRVARVGIVVAMYFAMMSTDYETFREVSEKPRLLGLCSNQSHLRRAADIGSPKSQRAEKGHVEACLRVYHDNCDIGTGTREASWGRESTIIFCKSATIPTATGNRHIKLDRYISRRSSFKRSFHSPGYPRFARLAI